MGFGGFLLSSSPKSASVAVGVSVRGKSSHSKRRENKRSDGYPACDWFGFRSFFVFFLLSTCFLVFSEEEKERERGGRKWAGFLREGEELGRGGIMLVPVTEIADVWMRIRRGEGDDEDATAPVLIFASAMDCDALAASRTLTFLLKVGNRETLVAGGEKLDLSGAMP